MGKRFLEKKEEKKKERERKRNGSSRNIYIPGRFYVVVLCGSER